MKTFNVGLLAGVLMTSLLATTPAMAMATEDVGNGFTPEESCEGRAEQLKEMRDRKAAVHADLNARQDKLEARAATLIATAQSEGVSTAALEKAVAQSRKNMLTVDNAYLIMDGVWAKAQETACDMTAQEFAKAVNYQSPVAQKFEKIGLAAGTYMQNVVDPLIAALTDEVLGNK